MPAFIVLLLSIIPQSLTLAETTDVVELNHFYDDNGRHVFDQVIWFDWDARHCRHQVRAWRLVKCPSHVPQRTVGGYVTLWVEESGLRKVTAMSMRETWTQFDPELVERETLAKEKRKGLREK